MWFGGEYIAEAFENNSSHYQKKRQKRWWNAYLLIYEKVFVNFSKFKISAKLFICFEIFEVLSKCFVKMNRIMQGDYLIGSAFSSVYNGYTVLCGNVTRLW